MQDILWGKDFLPGCATLQSSLRLIVLGEGLHYQGNEKNMQTFLPGAIIYLINTLEKDFLLV